MTQEFFSRLGFRFVEMLYLDWYTAKEDKENSIKILLNLRDNTDKIRKNYWQFKLNRLGYKQE